MLLRAARRKAQCETIRTTKLSTDLHLPWICTTQLRFQDEQRRLNASDARPRPAGLKSRRDGFESTNTTLRRSMATAIDTYGVIEDVPFEGLGSDLYGASGYGALRPFNPNTTLMINDSLSQPPAKHRLWQGIGGEVRDMVAVMRACLRIGRLQRAGAILHRFPHLKVEDDDLLEYHNEYLEAAVNNLIAKPSETASLSLHKWFEMEVNRTVQPNADTVALMLKASMQTPPGNRRDRLVRRYMDIVPGSVGLEALSVGGILSDDELAHITQISPNFNVKANEVAMDNKLLLKEISKAEPIADVELSAHADVPEVMAAEQKGYGLEALRQSLSLFTTGGDEFSGPDAARQRQRRLEEDSVRSAIDRWRQESENLSKMGMSSSLQTKSVGARMWKWQVALEERLREEMVKIDKSELKTNKTSKDADRGFIGPFLKAVPLEKLAAVTILATMGALTSIGVEKGITLSSAIMAIGHNVEDESLAEAIRASNMTKRVTVNGVGQKARAKRLDEMLKKLRKDKLRNVASSLPAIDDGREPWDPQWSATIRAKVGAFLLECLIDTAYVPVQRKLSESGEIISQMQPALSHSHQYKLGRKVGVVMANPAIVSQLLREPVHALLVKHLPMIVEPVPWSKFNKGGFLATPAKVMRIKLGDKDQRHYAEAAIAKGDLDQIFKGLDVLGKTPWKINKPVFETMLKAWNTGEAIANIAPSNPKLEYPPEPPISQDPTPRRRWAADVKLVENMKSGLHSQRCFQNFQLEISRALRDEIFYFPHNVDFRGRAYPIPPYLNHMGADHCRGLLMFGKGRALGESGLKWLKVHLANVFGFDKASLKEREEFSVEHLSDIYDSASNPLEGRKWWLGAEDPWQCLAACIELKAALDSPDPTSYVSHLPVHQDGTCNGLQHYAALGGDEWGAKQVNLVPGDRPADVYTAVANLVKSSIADDLARGSPYAQVLDGKITRKVVKQTVMTNVYGVTFIGAKAQVRKQLQSLYPDLPNTPTMHPGILASYVATKIFQALSTMFRGAHDIQYWLGECASRISVALTPEQVARFEAGIQAINKETDATQTAVKKSLSTVADQTLQFRSSVIWTTPLHMPVVQPYRQTQTKIIRTNLQSISLSEPHQSDPVSKRKQLQGFPPNFVHSLDATHMLLSALRCNELGLSFAAVHDSFWTHASDIDTMNGVLRDAFIRIHSEDVIGRLAAEFEVRYNGCFYKKPFKPGSNVATQIAEVRRSSEYRDLLAKHVTNGPISKVKADKSLQQAFELLLEQKRLRLLQSSDPSEVEEGQSMITPASICEQFDKEDTSSTEELASLGLGDMSTNDESAIGASDVEGAEMASAEDTDNSSPDEASEISELDEGETLSQTQKDAQYAEVEARMNSEVSSSSRFVKAMNKSSRPSNGRETQWAWLPLTFPPMPKKGNFNVESLKESHYFFS